MSNRQRFVQTDSQPVNDPEREDSFKVGIVHSPATRSCMPFTTRGEVISKMAANLVKEIKAKENGGL